MATNKHELAKQVALCAAGPLNRAGTDHAKKCMEDAVKGYQPSRVLPARVGASAGDSGMDINHSYPSGSGRHDGNHNINQPGRSNNPDHYIHISESRITNPNIYIRDPSNPLPINGNLWNSPVHYDHNNRVVYMWGWLLHQSMTHATFGDNNGLNYVKKSTHRCKP
jgi:hypothetical protein